MALYNGHNEDASGNILLSIGNGMTATVESGTTASQAYTKGSYLYYNNRLCKVIAAIASGNTLTVGTNIAYTSLGAELTSHLKANNGNEFYFDYQNGMYGYNTSASRAASTFVPFGDTDYVIPYLWARSDGDNRMCEAEYIFDVTNYKYFKVGSATSNYGLADFYILKDGVRVGGTEFINTQIDVQNTKQVTIKAVGNVGTSFTTVTVNNIQIYNKINSEPSSKTFVGTYSCIPGSNSGWGYGHSTGVIPCSSYKYAQVTSWDIELYCSGTISIANSGVVDISNVDTISYNLTCYGTESNQYSASFTIKLWN